MVGSNSSLHHQISIFLIPVIIFKDIVSFNCNPFFEVMVLGRVEIFELHVKGLAGTGIYFF